MENLVQVQDLKKYFSTSQGTLHAVDGVSFSIEKTKTLGIVGESGCGKSTLGRVILHLLEPTDGQIIYRGEDITKVDAKKLHSLRKDMQMIFQDPYSSINPRMSVEDIIAEPLVIHKLCGSSHERHERVLQLMDTVGLARRFGNSYPHELDGGRRQRIGIARALAVEPSFLVCDEPVSALDVSIQAQILNLLQDLQDELGLTYIFITHDLSVVRHISNDIGVMYLGQMVEKCESKRLFKEPIHPYTVALLSAIPRINIHQRTERIHLQGEITSPIDPGKECRFAKRCPHASEVCLGEAPKLEEVEPGHFVACHKWREFV